jgi:hypothetical protein
MLAYQDPVQVPKLGRVGTRETQGVHVRGQVRRGADCWILARLVQLIVVELVLGDPVTNEKDVGVVPETKVDHLPTLDCVNGLDHVKRKVQFIRYMFSCSSESKFWRSYGSALL